MEFYKQLKGEKPFCAYYKKCKIDGGNKQYLEKIFFTMKSVSYKKNFLKSTVEIEVLACG